jgi:hypothetical protein
MGRKKVLVKKLIVTLNTKGLSDSAKLEKFGKVCNGIDGDAIYGAIQPPTATTRSAINVVQKQVTQRDDLLVQAQTLTVSINTGMSGLNNTFVDFYVPFVQQNAAGNAEKVAETGLSTKADGTVAPDNVQTVTGFGLSTGTIAQSFDAHWDALPKKLTKEYSVEISLNPRDVIPVYVHKMSTSKSTALLTNLPLNQEVGVRIITVGKKDGVESIPSKPIIRMVVDPHN